MVGLEFREFRKSVTALNPLRWTKSFGTWPWSFILPLRLASRRMRKKSRGKRRRGTRTKRKKRQNFRNTSFLRRVLSGLFFLYFYFIIIFLFLYLSHFVSFFSPQFRLKTWNAQKCPNNNRASLSFLFSQCPSLLRGNFNIKYKCWK